MNGHAHHHDHDDHAHDHRAAPTASRSAWSLLRASAFDRLLGALAIIGVMWAGVWWALQ